MLEAKFKKQQKNGLKVVVSPMDKQVEKFIMAKLCPRGKAAAKRKKV